MRPGRFGRVAPDDFVTREVRLFVGIPLNRSVIRKAGRKGDGLRSRGRRRQRRQGCGIHARDVGDVIEIVELGQVSKLNAVLHAHVLMLMLIILIRFSEPDCGIASFEKGLMIAPATITIAAIDHPHLHRGNIELTNLLDETR